MRRRREDRSVTINDSGSAHKIQGPASPGLSRAEYITCHSGGDAIDVCGEILRK